MSDIDDRRRGALLGLAVGDALGAAVEFSAPGTFPPVIGYRGGGPHGLAPGEWADDTSMALALADSLARSGFDVIDQAERYVAWFRRGEYSVNGRCFDIGVTTQAALTRFQKAGDPLTSGDPSERASGNGSIMRLAPVPIFYVDLFPNDAVELARLAADSSRPTHASPQCLSACRYLAVVLAGLMHGLDRDEVLSPDWSVLRRSAGPSRCTRRSTPSPAVVSGTRSRRRSRARDTSSTRSRRPFGRSTGPSPTAGRCSRP